MLSSMFTACMALSPALSCTSDCCANSGRNMLDLKGVAAAFGNAALAQLHLFYDSKNDMWHDPASSQALGLTSIHMCLRRYTTS